MMSAPGSELERPGTQGSNRQAWSQGSAPVTGPGQAEGYECNDNEAIQKKGCWYSFSTCVSRMWATRQMTKDEDREIYVRTTLRELVVYIIFLVILCILTFGMTSPTMYYYTKVLSDLFLDTPYPDTKNTFRGSTQVMDFWRFTENVLLDGLYWEYWYDRDQTATQADNRNILYENRMLGVARLRQIRVRNDSCMVPENFQRAIRQCYDVYSTNAEDKSNFGVNVNGTAWTYFSEEELQGGSHWGKIATYSGAGSYQDLGVNKSVSRDILASLRENLWIQRGTRAIFIDFTVYNANINLFCVIKLLFEFPATGGIIPSWSFRTVKLLRYVTPMDFFVMACEFIFAFFIIYYIIEESLEIKTLKCAYFKSIWNILDLLVIGLALLCIGFSVFTTLTIGSKLEVLLEDANKFADFEFLGYWQTQFNSIAAVCVFFSWFKLFKYISFNKTMTQLFSTLSRCAKDVGGFTVMFFIVFFAFAQLGYLLFGTQVRDFRSFINAVFTLLRTILGDFNFHEIEDANRVLGPIFFLCYVFFVFFVLLNMFLAIINDTYSEVKAEIANQRNEFEIADYFKRGYNNMMGKLGKRDKLIDIQNALKLSDANSDGMLTFDEIRANLKKANFSDMEIEMFFAKYDTDGNRLLEADEVKRMLADLEGQKTELDKQIKKEEQPPKSTSEAETRPASASSGHGSIVSVSFEEFSVLQRRVDRLEHSIGSIVSKIDAVLVKLDTMEKSKHKRRETMGKILDTITENDGMDDSTKRKQMEKLVREELEKWDGDSRPPTSGK
ncbi:polycystin-2-like [Penaeus monodon]|uniref:polycystin-2-like n=1 Tax=Penaeus monodon TaxID=6687 RepID=UPI0018A7CA7A|nr:polycystin-2-like [Penaeus monodon]